MSSAEHRSANPTAAPLGPTDGETASASETADNARHVALVRRMGEMAMGMAETLHAAVTASTHAPDAAERVPELCLAFTRVTRCARLAVVLEQELLGLRPVAARRAAANGNRPGFARGETGDGGDGERGEGRESFAEYDDAALEARIDAVLAEVFPYGVPTMPYDPADPDNPIYLDQCAARREGMAHIDAVLLHGEAVEWPPKTGPWSKPSPTREAYRIWFAAERERLRVAGEAAAREPDPAAPEGALHQCGPPPGGGFR